MSINVADLVATLRMDSSDFDRNMSRSESQTSSFASTLASKLGSAAQTGALAITGMGIAAGVTLARVLSTGIAYNTLQQTSRAAMTTLMGGAKEANAQMDKLDVFAKTSPFAKSTFITAQQQLIGFGLSAEKVIPTLDAVQNAVAAVGGSNEDIASIAGSLADVTATGKITGDTLNELGSRGINAAKIIGDGMGMTVEETRKAISKGTIDSAEALTVLVDGMQKKFAGAAANVKNTMTGAADRVKSATRDIGAAMAEPFVSKYGGGRLVEWTNQWADALRKLEKNIPGIANMLLNRFAPGLVMVGTALSKLSDLAGGINAANVTKLFDKMAANAPGVAVLAGAIAGLSASALAGIPIIGRFAAMLNPWVAIFLALVAASPELRSALGDVLTALVPLLPVLGKLTGAVSGALTSALTASIPLVEGFADVLGVIVVAAIPIIDMIANLAGAFSELPGGIQTAIVAFGTFLLLRGPITAMFAGIAASATGLVTTLRAGGLAGALKTILAVFGGPWGLAIGAAVAVLGFFAFKNKEASDAVKAFSQTLDENTGQITKNTYAKAAEDLSKYSDKFKQLGLSTADAARIAVDGGTAYDQVRGKIKDLDAALSTYQSTMGTDTERKKAKADFDALARTFGMTAEQVEALGNDGLFQLQKALETTNGQVEKSKGVWADLNESAQQSEPVNLRLADAIKTVGDEAASSEDRITAYKLVIDAMNGVLPSVAEQNRNLAKSTRDLAGFLGEVDEAGQRVNTGLVDMKDGAVANTEAGDQLNAMFQNMQTQGLAAATAASDLAKANGDSAGAAAAADAALKPFRDTLQNLADQGLLTQDEVNAVSKALFGVPGETTAVITDENSASAVKLKVDELTRTIGAMPKGKQVMITEPQSPGIISKLHELGYVTVTLPDGNVAIIQQGAENAKYAIDQVGISASAIDGAVSTIRINTIYTESWQPGAAGGGDRRPGGYLGNASGNLLEYFADGGIHPALTPMSPIAQIVPKNTWRVVGDNMTVPELYAPLDGSARSLALMREGASRMGFSMVPRSAMRGYAVGAITSSTVSQQATQAATQVSARQPPNNVFTGDIYASDLDDIEAQAKQRKQDRNAVYQIGSIGTVG